MPQICDMAEIDNLKLQKKIVNILFEDKDKYEEMFAKEFARNGYKVLDAYNAAYHMILKVKSSSLLGQSNVWQIVFEELVKKKNPNEKEIYWISEYNRIVDLYELSPFHLYSLYVEKNSDTQKPISNFISNDPIKDMIILINLHHFMNCISRDKFIEAVSQRIKEEYEIIQQLPETLKELHKQLNYMKKKDDIETDEIIECCLKHKKGNNPLQTKLKLD